MKKYEAYLKDGIFNQTTGLGTRKDKSFGNIMVPEDRSDTELEWMYRSSRLARRFVELEPNFIYKEGYVIETESDEVKRIIEDLDRRLKIPEKLHRARVWARLYGGALVMKLIRDGRDAYEPADPSGDILRLHVMDKRWVTSTGRINSDFLSENYGEPLSYYVTPDQGEQFIFDTSRILKVDGDLLPRQQYIENDYWHQSCLEGMFEAITDFAAAHHSSAILAQDFRQSIYKIANLEEMIAAGEEDLVRKRAETIDVLRSVLNAIVLGENETFEMLQNPVSGLSDLVDRATIRLCIESGIPHTILLGESPSGLGATGESEKTDWYDHIRTVQETSATPQHKSFYDAELLRQGITDAEYTIKWLPLQTENPKVEAEKKKLVAERDNMYFMMGAITSEEVREGRFGQEDGFDRDIRIDGDEDMELKEEPNQDDINSYKGMING